MLNELAAFASHALLSPPRSQPTRLACMHNRVITGLFCLHRSSRRSPPRHFSSTTSLLTVMGALATQTVNTTKRLEALRLLMHKPENNISAYVVPSEDQREFWSSA